MPKANGGEGRWVGGRRERNEGRMEGRYEGWKERQFCFSSSKFILISPTEIFGVFMQISKFYLGQKLVQGIFKYKKYSMRRTFSHPKLIFPFQYFFHPKFNMPLGQISSHPQFNLRFGITNFVQNSICLWDIYIYCFGFFFHPQFNLSFRMTNFVQNSIWYKFLHPKSNFPLRQIGFSEAKS